MGLDPARDRRAGRSLHAVQAEAGRPHAAPFRFPSLTGKRKKNPRKVALATAADEYEKFHWGRSARKVKRMNATPAPKVLTEIGELETVVYRTKKGAEPTTSYEHDFGEDGGERPVLAYDPRTKRLHIVGGDYRIERRGIVD